MMESKALLLATLCLLAACLAVSGANDTDQPNRRYKRKYGMCPPKFTSISNECYYISPNKLNWLDAYFECKDHNSKLAEPMMYEDKVLRRTLQKMGLREDLWIGGNYNWKLKKWQWGHNGREIEYQSFSQMVPRSSQDLTFHCALLKADIKFRWSAAACTDKMNYICQHRMPLVSEMGRSLVYEKWNKTYPNERANEKLVYIVSEGNNRTQSEYGKPRLYNSVKRVMQSNPSIRPAHRRRANRPKKPVTAPTAADRRTYIPPEVVGRKQHLAQYAPDASNDINTIDNGHRNGGGGGWGGSYHSAARFNVDFSPRNGKTREASFPRGHRMRTGEEHHRLPHQHRHQPGAHKPTKRTQQYYEKQASRDFLRKRLQKLTPEEQQAFFQTRAMRKKLKEQKLLKLKLERANEVVP
ncbi:AGAP006267-PA [Anopheles gambiae str. PEST]|uniref:AGAP006267-PA n=1 Tax=Anopheles gambiae TaxID=7165 RepID=Q7Q5Q5_ANOGA|nr:AGAP006267-PA [Anopheles gambiae str. PEST]